MSKLVVALGNPGSQYENTRHNIGWQAIEFLEFYNTLNFQKKFKGEYAQKSIDGETVYFLKPQTFMNLSGESVVPLMQFFKVKIEDILIVHDEIDLPYGTVLFKDGGGLAGHNGLKSIAACLGRQDFMRLRLGVGRPVHGSVSNWVLSGYGNDEAIALDQYLTGAAEAIYTLVTEGYTKSARKFNKKSFV